MQTLNHNAEIELTEMYRDTIPFLEEYQWEMEEDRWAELIIILFSGIGINPVVSKQAVDLLKGLNLLTPKDLEKTGDEQIAFICQVLLKAEMEVKEAELAARALLKLSRVINAKCNGYIQKWLRSHGEKMVKELQTYLIRSGVESQDAKRIATVWLQNVCNLPLLLESDDHIKNFCSKFKLTEAGLANILDELGLNACVADDLLAIHDEPNGSMNGSDRKSGTQVKKKSQRKMN
jgi:hypothetical protein